MTPQKRILKVIVAAFIFMLCSTSLSHAQATAEMFNDNDNSVVFRIENLDENNTPTKILLVYDSNLITLESTSVKTKKYKAKSVNYAAYESYKAASALNSVLAVEMEREQEVEDWMLQPFTTKITQADNFKTDLEEDMALESWMTDLNSW